MKRALTIIFVVLFIDQAVKFWVKTHMFLGKQFNILGDWFIVHFTENNGMAFGLEMDWEYGKPLLTIFRMFAAVGIAWYMWYIIKNKMHSGLATSMALIFAGAVGNIIDSIFYGVLFSSSEYQTATFMPAEGGYAGWLHGRVVDMFYFPLVEGHFPDWFPLWGGEEFIFFRPVFNVADSSITIGVLLILLFQKKFYPPANEAAVIPTETTDASVVSTQDSTDTTK